MNLPDIEVVAAIVHAEWIAQKRAQGVTSRPNETTGEEQMRPYDQLSDVVKDLDRSMVKAVYAAIKEAMETEPYENPSR